MSSDGEEILDPQKTAAAGHKHLKVKREKRISGIPHDKELLIMQNSIEENDASNEISKIS